MICCAPPGPPMSADASAVIHELIEGAPEVAWPDPLPLFPAGETPQTYPLDALPAVIGEAIGSGWLAGSGS